MGRITFMTTTKTILTAQDILTLAPPSKRKGPLLVHDGNGLYLQTMPSGSRSYIFRYTLNKRTRAMGLGPVRSITLSEARKRARELRVQVDKGIDPLVARQVAPVDHSATTHRITFKRCAELYIEVHKVGWKSAKHAAQWNRTLSQYAFPIIGKMPVADVGVTEMERILHPLWTTINETASRLRGRIEKILGWATVKRYRTGDNPARWNGHLSTIFPKRALVRPVRHHNALPWADAPSFMKDLRSKATMSSYLLQFLILTAVRTTEARAATWDELDFAKELWIVPEIRMKAGRKHRVPLSSSALALLKRLDGFRQAVPEAERSTFVFPSSSGKTCLSNMAMLTLLKNGLGRRDITPHGMRSTFRDRVAERADFPRELAEAALAHKLRDKVEAAYQRGDLLEKRRVLMDAWGSYLNSSPSVPSIDGSKGLASISVQTL